VLSYTNKALCYYQSSKALLNVDKAVFKQQLDECKAALELVDWDGNTQPNSLVNDHLVSLPVPTASSCMLLYKQDSEDDSDCPAPLPNYKGMKFDPSNLTKLYYNSDIAWHTN
jgi:hypothetical protein